MPYSAPGGSSVVLQAYRLVTSVEIKALFTTAIVIVPGVANKAYTVVGSQLIHRFGGTAYSNVTGLLMIQTGGSYWQTYPANILAEGADHINSYATGAGAADYALGSVEGQDLNIQDDTQNPTLGNGTLEVWVWYVATDV